MIGPEQFKPIPGESPFWVSQTGRVIRRVNVRHPSQKQWLEIKQHAAKGTVRVTAKKRHAVARLVYAVFIGPLEPGKVICHLNGDYTDNRWQNLYQGTQAENIAHKKLHGTQLSCERHPRSLLTNKQAIEIKKDLETAMRSSSGRLQRGEIRRIAEHHGIRASLVEDMSRKRATYSDLH